MRLVTIAGIEVRAHYSSLFVFGAVMAVIAYGWLPTVTPLASWPERIAVSAIIASALAASIIAHELGHAIVARRRGYKVSAISLYLFSGAAQINDESMSPSDEIAVALAGPATSVLLAALFMGSGVLVFKYRPQPAVLLFDVGIANAALAVFNLIPGFPMDGGRALRGLLTRRSGNIIAATKRAALAGRLAGYAIVAGGCLLAVRSSLFFGAWAAIIGWFLAGLAQSHYRATVLRAALGGLLTRDLCARNLPVLQTGDTVSAAAAHFGLGAKTRCLAVLFGERPAGIVTDVQVARVPADVASQQGVAAVMTRIADLPVLSPDDDAPAILGALAASPTASVMVAAQSGAEFYGIVRREDVARYVEMVEELGNSAAVSARNLRGLTPRLPAARRDAIID